MKKIDTRRNDNLNIQDELKVNIKKISKRHVLVKEIDNEALSDEQILERELDELDKDYNLSSQTVDRKHSCINDNVRSSHKNLSGNSILDDKELTGDHTAGNAAIIDAATGDAATVNVNSQHSNLKPFPRLHLIDSYRGFVILVMIAYHFCYDLFVLLKGDYSWIGLMPVFIWEQYICWSFNLMSGFVWQLGKKHCIKRGIIVNLCGFLCTFVTLIIMPQSPIIFGVLNLLGCAMILMYPISIVTKKVDPVAGAIVSFIIFAITYGVPFGHLGIFRLAILKLPNSLYVSDIFAPYGFPSRTFISSDYFPLFPWLFLYITGYFLWKIISPKPSFQRLATRKIPVLNFFGKHSLLIYLLHQPICFGLIYLIAYLCK